MTASYSWGAPGIGWVVSRNMVVEGEPVAVSIPLGSPAAAGPTHEEPMLDRSPGYTRRERSDPRVHAAPAVTYQCQGSERSEPGTLG